jgi:DNA replication protein DnaC
MSNDLLTLKDRAQALGLHGLIAQWENIAQQAWVETVVHFEERERARRSLERRTRASRLGRFKPLADFDWKHPKKLDRAQIDRFMTLEFIQDATNIFLIGPSGAGKTMIAKNLAHQAIINGYSSLFISAHDLLTDLGEQRTGSSMLSRLRYYARPDLLVIDELGYLGASHEHADHLFELVTRRYQQKPIIITANRSIVEWGNIFPNASCLVALIDRLIHHSEVVNFELAESFRLRDARERTEHRNKLAKTGVGAKPTAVVRKSGR